MEEVQVFIYAFQNLHPVIDLSLHTFQLLQDSRAFAAEEEFWRLKKQSESIQRAPL